MEKLHEPNLGFSKKKKIKIVNNFKLLTFFVSGNMFELKRSKKKKKKKYSLSVREGKPG